MRRRRDTDVSVERVYHGDLHARVSTIGRSGTRQFVLVPGIGVSAHYFERLALQLNEFGPAIALDLPGFGGVPHPRRRLSISDYAALVGGVIDELGLRDPVLVGHSMGTQIVAELATSRTMTDLVLLSPVLNPHERRLRTAFRRFLQSSRHEPPRIVAVSLYAYFLCGPRWFSRMLPVLLRYRLEDVLPRITANTLVVAGELDALCPRPWIQEVADLLPQAQAWMIPGAAHSVMHGNAEDVARLCVRHARREQPDDNIIRLARHDPGKEPDPSLSETRKAVHGRLTELVGIATDNDELIAKGKALHAEASASAAEHDSPDSEGDERPSEPGESC